MTSHYSLNVFYDNTVYIYINGKLFYKNDANCGIGDWNGDYEPINYNIDDQPLTIKEFPCAGYKLHRLLNKKLLGRTRA